MCGDMAENQIGDLGQCPIGGSRSSPLHGFPSPVSSRRNRVAGMTPRFRDMAGGDSR
jgi:hypothetical protein